MKKLLTFALVLVLNNNIGVQASDGSGIVKKEAALKYLNALILLAKKEQKRTPSLVHALNGFIANYEQRKRSVEMGKTFCNPGCSACGRTKGLKLCGGECQGAAFYCNKDCQRRHWSRHKSVDLCFKESAKK